MLIKSKPAMGGMKVWIAADAKNFFAQTPKYTLARPMEQGRSCQRYGLLTRMELEEVLTFIISLQAVN